MLYLKIISYKSLYVNKWFKFFNDIFILYTLFLYTFICTDEKKKFLSRISKFAIPDKVFLHNSCSKKKRMGFPSKSQTGCICHVLVYV